MDADGLASVQEDQELAATPEEIARIAAIEALVDVHTTMPGIVKSFDPKTQSAKVQPAIMRLWRDGGWKALPECVDCPVQFPRWGNFIITGPVAVGDEGALHFSERSIDNWWARGGVQEQCEMRMHDLSDGFFAPGYSSKGRVPANISTDGLEIRTLDGSTLFRLEGDTAYVGGKDGSVKMLLGETYRTAEAQMDQSLIGALPAVIAAAAAIPANPIELAAFVALYPTIAAFIAALGTFLGGAWLPALQGFEAQSAAFLATKGKVV
jgi:hypothetical protein